MLTETTAETDVAPAPDDAGSTPVANGAVTAIDAPAETTADLQAADPRTGNPAITWKNLHGRRVVGLAVVHAIACLALWPALFSWPAFAACLVGVYVFGTLGINISWHRQLTHRSFKSPKWLEWLLCVLGVCCLQDSPIKWVAEHRLHHRDSDHDDDPHSPHRPIRSFFWSHCGWLLFHHPRSVGDTPRAYRRHAQDLADQRFYRYLDRHWQRLAALQMLLFPAVGYALDGPMGAASWLVWAFAVRVVLVWHITWSINSVTHLWGKQPYATGDESRNNVVTALVSNGEGWHNNHHQFPASARHGLEWWQLDVSWYTIRLLEAVGLATDVKLPSRRLVDGKKTA